IIVGSAVVTRGVVSRAVDIGRTVGNCRCAVVIRVVVLGLACGRKAKRRADDRPRKQQRVNQLTHRCTSVGKESVKSHFRPALSLGNAPYCKSYACSGGNCAKATVCASPATCRQLKKG